MSKGIDYGMGQTNIDKSTGIRYGVISIHCVTQAWCDSSEAHYGEPHCPKCGNPAIDVDTEVSHELATVRATEEYETARGACGDYICDDCRYQFDGDEAYGDEPLSHYIDDGEYSAECGQDGDIFVFRSPYYTRAAYCSPCAPGACYLTSPQDEGDKAYCFGADWFDDEEPCPYPVYRVDTDELVYWPAGYYDGILFFTADEYAEDWSLLGARKRNSGLCASDNQWNSIE